ALFLGLIVWLYARPAGWWREAMLLPLFVLWSFMHAEWYVGAGTAALLLWSPGVTKSPLWRRLAWPVAWLLGPVTAFLLLHPAGVKPLLSPFAFLFQSGPQLSVREYSLATWWTMPLAAPMVLALLWPAFREFR